MKFLIILAVSWAVSACAHYPKECYPGIEREPTPWKVTVLKKRNTTNGN
jgi:hypothetical protein